MDGGWELLYAQACKAFLHQRPRQQADAADGDRLQHRKHKKTLILSKKGNLSKAYKQLTQGWQIMMPAIIYGVNRKGIVCLS